MILSDTTSNFTWEYTCKTCGEVLTDKQVSYSRGICPMCGHISGNTFVDCDIQAIKYRTVTELNWKFPFIHTFTRKVRK